MTDGGHGVFHGLHTAFGSHRGPNAIDALGSWLRAARAVRGFPRPVTDDLLNQLVADFCAVEENLARPR